MLSMQRATQSISVTYKTHLVIRNQYDIMTDIHLGQKILWQEAPVMEPAISLCLVLEITKCDARPCIPCQ